MVRVFGFIILPPKEAKVVEESVKEITFSTVFSRVLPAEDYLDYMGVRALQLQRILYPVINGGSCGGCDKHEYVQVPYQKGFVCRKCGSKSAYKFSDVDALKDMMEVQRMIAGQHAD